MNIKARFFILLAVLAWIGPAPVTARPLSAEAEYIILSGGPALRTWEEYREAPKDQHDRYWGNFIKAARIRIDQLRSRQGAALNLTWMVYRPAYETRQREDQIKRPPELCSLSEITSLAAARQVRLVWFSRTDQLIDYLNAPRPEKLAGFEYFGHSNCYGFLLDYSNDILGVSSCYLHVMDLKKLRRGLFHRQAEVKSWGCNTGDYMSGIWKRRTGHSLIGAGKSGDPSSTGKTDYSAISDGISLPTVNGRWVD